MVRTDAAMLGKVLALVILFGVGGGNAVAGEIRCLASGHEKWPPYSQAGSDEPLTGAGVEILRRAVSRTGAGFAVVNAGPWKRVLQNLSSGPLDLIVAALDSNERRSRFLLTIPYDTVSIVGIVRRDSSITAADWDELKGLTALVAHGSTFGDDWDRFAAANLTLARPPTTGEALQMLRAGRGDIAVAPEAPARMYLQANHLNRDLRILSPPLITQPLQALIRRDSACAMRLESINAALRLMIASGETAAILSEYQSHSPAERTVQAVRP